MGDFKSDPSLSGGSSLGCYGSTYTGTDGVHEWHGSCALFKATMKHLPQGPFLLVSTCLALNLWKHPRSLLHTEFASTEWNWDESAKPGMYQSLLRKSPDGLTVSPFKSVIKFLALWRTAAREGSWKFRKIGDVKTQLKGWEYGKQSSISCIMRPSTSVTTTPVRSHGFSCSLCCLHCCNGRHKLRDAFRPSKSTQST